MFHARRLAQSPFWLASSAVALAGWVVALIGCILSTTEAFLYWTLAFLLATLLGTVYVIGSGSVLRHRLSLLAFHTINFVYTTRAVDGKLFLPKPEDVLAGVGFAILSAVLLGWLMVVGTEDNAMVLSVASSGSRRKVAQFNGQGRSPANGAAAARSHSPSMLQAHQRSPSNMANAPQPLSHSGSRPQSAAGSGSASPVAGHGMDIGRDVEYMFKGQAMYAYTASPDDANELSFSKGEILDIVENKGKWWQAKKADGSIGIVPSNYIKLLQ